MRAEQLRHPDLFRHARFADTLEDVILGHLAAEWQRATPGGNGLNLGPEGNLLVQQRISRGTILGAFVGIVEMLHDCAPDAVSFVRA